MEDDKNIVEKIERKDNGAMVPGIILILLGVLFLLPRLGLDFGNLWPTFVLVPGISLIVFYGFSKNKEKNVGLVIPIVILILSSIFLYYMAAVSWQGIDILWPVFPFIVGLALYVFYYFGDRKLSGVFISANILAGFGILFLVLNLISYNFWPLILVIGGMALILRSKR